MRSRALILFLCAIAFSPTGGQNSSADDARAPVENIQKLTRVSTKRESLENEYNKLVGESGLEWLSSLYNPHAWNSSRVQAFKTLSGPCRSAIKQFINGLSNGELWAAKSE
ncbi:nose resistant to fluoxetine protein 6-like [Nesidiocoris tenuis]|uniref:Nose resistant to fluoxetine protein 6-like n=2 Tax=Nesidiocoris tenuis TaxID=355587 RepID=A0ABN7ANX1_9HEMI|nr:nose resistant to fluoxetine protein 6-like [Nesidiocoris tenuis]